MTSTVKGAQLATSARAALTKAADKRYAEQIARLVPGIRTRGVKVPKIRALAGAMAKEKPEFETACALLDEFCEGGFRDDMLCGIFLLARSKSRLPDLEWKQVAFWLNAVNNWETCDQLAMNIAAPLAAARPELVSELVKLTRSKNQWQRRFAIATSAALNQKGRNMAEATLKICEPLLNDPEPTVRKAVAWAIRETCKSNEQAAFEFLVKYKAKMHPTVLREASEKLTPAQKIDLAGKK